MIIIIISRSFQSLIFVIFIGEERSATTRAAEKNNTFSDKNSNCSSSLTYHTCVARLAIKSKSLISVALIRAVCAVQSAEVNYVQVQSFFWAVKGENAAELILLLLLLYIIEFANEFGHSTATTTNTLGEQEDVEKRRPVRADNVRYDAMDSGVVLHSQ